MDWDNSTTLYNISFIDFPIDFGENDTKDELVDKIYIIGSLTLVSLCAVSFAVNAFILLSVCWIRRPMTPTLHISLSLAGSDLWSCTVVGIGLIVNSLLPKVYGIKFNVCHNLFLEAFRMGGMYTTIGHLVALAGNHYLGIRKPLQYPALMTARYIISLEVILWIVPPLTFLFVFAVIPNDGFSVTPCSFKFLIRTKFRSVCSYVFLGSSALMAAIYIHIYLLVRKHQANRNRFRRMGSTYSRSTQVAENHHNQRRNEKALCTTLLIVGSILLGWLPATIYFYLFCEDCIFDMNWEPTVIRTLTLLSINFLLILKTSINSYIYAARMKEIKDAMRRMKHTLMVSCCKFGRRDVNGHDCDGSRQILSRTSTRRSKRTVLCRLNSIPRQEAANREVIDNHITPL